MRFEDERCAWKDSMSPPRVLVAILRVCRVRTGDVRRKSSLAAVEDRGSGSATL